MGETIRIMCDKCEVKKDINIGCGMLAINIDVIKEILCEKEKEEFCEYISQNRFKQYSWEYVAGYCNECNDIESSTKVICITQHDKKIVYGKKCDVCGHDIKVINIKKSCKCPVCKDGKITSYFSGMWD